jgi:hypothetical protein
MMAIHFCMAGYNCLTITVVTSDAADGSYAAGEVIDVDVTFRRMLLLQEV